MEGTNLWEHTRQRATANGIVAVTRVLIGCVIALFYGPFRGADLAPMRPRRARLRRWHFELIAVSHVFLAFVG